MRLLHVEVQGSRYGILARRDVLEGRRAAVDDAALQPVGVLVEEAEAEDAESIRVRLQLLHDEVVVLARSEEHTSELQSLMRHSYAVFCLKKKTNNRHHV